MKDLNTIEGKVKAVLKSNEEARNDDMKLYFCVCDYCLEEKGLRVGDMPFETVMTEYRSLGIPNFESVGRIRRKLQSQHAELSGNTETKRIRMAQERVYRHYAKKRDSEV